MNNIAIVRYLKELKKIMAEEKEHLIELDSVVGDGDLGLTMSDGFAAAYDTAAAETKETDIGRLLFKSGRAMAREVPSTMGTLMASGLMGAGKALKGKTELGIADIARLFQAYEEGVAKLGRAKPGEKTFLDGMHPAVAQLEAAAGQNLDIRMAAEQAAAAALQGYEDTQEMLAVHGRAATRGEQSRTFKDPGAYVAYLLLQGFYRSLDR